MALTVSVIFFVLILTVTTSHQSKEEAYRKIYGGVRATLEEFPHLMILINGLDCGANIISKNWAVTAAHCFFGKIKKKNQMIIGGSDVINDMNSKFRVIKYLTHPKYSLIEHNYDVAVVKISGNFFIDPNLKAVKLPEPCEKSCCEVCPGTVVKVAGYGRIEKGNSTEYLRKIEQTIGSKRACGKVWRSKIHSSCQGDSGSGVIKDKNLMVGIISFGPVYCGDSKFMAGYTRVEDPGVREFIRKHTGV